MNVQTGRHVLGMARLCVMRHQLEPVVRLEDLIPGELSPSTARGCRLLGGWSGPRGCLLGRRLGFSPTVYPRGCLGFLDA